MTRPTRSSTVSVVLIDIDGTLLDSNDAHARSWVDALAEHGHATTFERLRPLIGKGGDKMLLEVAGIDEDSDEGQRISDTRADIFKRGYLPGLKPTRGARDLLLRLRDIGLQLVIATSASGGDLDALLQQAGVTELFDDAADSSDAGASKPDPDIVLAALAKAGARADHAVMLGDTPHDIEAARAAGVDTIIVRCGGWWKDTDFAGAIAIYDNPAELLAGLDDSVLRRR